MQLTRDEIIRISIALSARQAFFESLDKFAFADEYGDLHARWTEEMLYRPERGLDSMLLDDDTLDPLTDELLAPTYSEYTNGSDA